MSLPFRIWQYEVWRFELKSSGFAGLVVDGGGGAAELPSALTCHNFSSLPAALLLLLFLGNLTASEAGPACCVEVVAAAHPHDREPHPVLATVEDEMGEDMVSKVTISRSKMLQGLLF